MEENKSFERDEQTSCSQIASHPVSVVWEGALVMEPLKCHDTLLECTSVGVAISDIAMFQSFQANMLQY